MIKPPSDEDFPPKKSYYNRELALELSKMDNLTDKVYERLRRTRENMSATMLLSAEQEPSDETKSSLKLGFRAVEKVKEQGTNVPLTPLEEKGLESVILVMHRPALLIQNGDFATPEEPWTQLLNTARTEIKARIPSVGRIEVVSNGTIEEIATGFLVGEDLLMTNRHVVAGIAVQDPFDATKWELSAQLKPQINFKAEFQVQDSVIFPLLKVIGTHPNPKIDLGLLRISRQSMSSPGAPLPLPLKLASELPTLDESRNLYVLGYPASDNEGVIPAVVLNDIFGNIFGVKRLAPGQFAAEFAQDGIFSHDCSTLGGNSGSCVIDLKTEMIIGLHVVGGFMKTNQAVSLWKLNGDPLLSGLGLNFG